MSSSSTVTELADARIVIDHPATGVVRMTLANPAKRNALGHATLDGIAQFVGALKDVKCLVITGEGPTFSAGYDLGGIPPETFAEEAERLIAHPFANAIEAIEAFPFPTVAALNGHAIGGGLELAISCDIRIASSGAKLGMPPAKLGLVYSHTGLRKFIDTVGAARTRELFLTGYNIDAETALTWGLVNRVVAEDELQQTALKYATDMAANAPLSQIGNKRIIRELLASEGKLEAKLEKELIKLRKACFDSQDFLEGVRSFNEKRPAQWQGR